MGPAYKNHIIKRHIKVSSLELHVQAQLIILGLSCSKSVCNLCLVAENLMM